MQTKESRRLVAGMAAVLEKGGPGSGNWGHAGRPGQVGGSVAQGGMPLTSEEKREFASIRISAGRLDRFLTPRFRLKQDYAGLKDVEKAEVLKAAVSHYSKGGPRYTKVAELGGVPGAAMEGLKRANAAVGAFEAIRNRALGSLRQTVGDKTAERKVLHAVVKLQELAQRANGVREDFVATLKPGAEIAEPSKPVRQLEFITPEGNLRPAVYDRADSSTKKDVMRSLVGSYKPRYTKVAELPEGASDKAVNANKMIGANEGVRSALFRHVELAQQAGDDVAERKLLHAAFNLQRDAARFARIRTLELGRQKS